MDHHVDLMVIGKRKMDGGYMGMQSKRGNWAM